MIFIGFFQIIIKIKLKFPGNIKEILQYHSFILRNRSWKRNKLSNLVFHYFIFFLKT